MNNSGNRQSPAFPVDGPGVIRFSTCLILFLLLAVCTFSRGSDNLQSPAAFRVTAADSAVHLLKQIVFRNSPRAEVPAALHRLLQYYCFLGLPDSVEYYNKVYGPVPFHCPASTGGDECWRIQLGVFTTRDNALRFQQNCAARLHGVTPFLEPHRKGYAVVIGPYAGKKEARAQAKNLKNSNAIEDYVIRKCKD